MVGRASQLRPCLGIRGEATALNAREIEENMSDNFC